MRFLFPFCIAILTFLVSCTHESRIDSVREVPIKTSHASPFDTGLLRAQTTYVMHGAMTSKERRERLGQYYYVSWYDAHPDQSATLCFEYQMAHTGSRVHKKSISFPSARSGGSKKVIFSVIGDEYFNVGPVLTWKLSLLVNGKSVSSHRSYLWRDDATTSGEVAPPSSFDPIPSISGVNASSIQSVRSEIKAQPSNTKETSPEATDDTLNGELQEEDVDSAHSPVQPGTVSGSTLLD